MILSSSRFGRKRASAVVATARTRERLFSARQVDERDAADTIPQDDEREMRRER